MQITQVNRNIDIQALQFTASTHTDFTTEGYHTLCHNMLSMLHSTMVATLTNL